MEYDSDEAREQAKETLQKLMEKHGDADKSNWLHVGSLDSAKFLGLQSLHTIKGIRHAGFGDFMDENYYYKRVADTKAGRIMHRLKLP